MVDFTIQFKLAIRFFFQYRLNPQLEGFISVDGVAALDKIDQ